MTVPMTAAMIRERHVAVHAVRHITARLAFQYRSETAPVLKQNHLPSVRQRLVDFFAQQRREQRLLHDFFASQCFHVDDMNLRD